MEQEYQATEVLFIGGVFAKENEDEVISQAKKGVEFSANLMQMKLISGFRKTYHTEVVSAPFIGSYPNQSSTFSFKGFSSDQDLCSYVRFNNLWGFRSISREKALKKKIKGFIESDAKRKLIVVYSAHDPFLSAAVYAKKKDPGIKICLVAPDLPQYMNLESKRGFLYDFFKRIDIISIRSHIKHIDSSVVLTKEMATELKLDDRPHIVAEGIVEDTFPDIDVNGRDTDIKKIVYAGKMYYEFGIKDLVDAFTEIKGNEYRLILCGSGDAVGYIKKKAEDDQRIIYTGQITPDEVKKHIKEAAVLVNPRTNEGTYARYSFPSKDIEYLLSGKPLVAYMLDGMPECYRNYIFEIEPEKDSIGSLIRAIEKALSSTPEEIGKRYYAFLQHVRKNLMASSVAKKIIRMSFGQEPDTDA